MAAQIARLPRIKWLNKYKGYFKKWPEKYKGYLKVIAAQIKSLFHKKVAQIERSLQINGYVNTKVTSNKWLHKYKVASNRLEKYKGYRKVIAAKIQSLFHKKVAQIERLLQSNGYVNTKVTSNKWLQKYNGYFKKTGEKQRLPQSNCCTNTKFILEKVGANTKLSEIMLT